VPIGWNKILFAFETSKCIKDKAARVIELALIYGGELRTLSVMNSFFDSNGKVPTDKECLLKRSALEYLQSVHMQADRSGVKNEVAFLSGRFHKVVGKFAREEQINMIIVGSNGGMKAKWGFGRSPIGSIISSAPCPLLFLRHR
jgi:nucleotide-binding universal stress UspA family protein